MKVKLFVFIGIVLLAVLLAGMYPVRDDFGVRSDWFMNWRSSDAPTAEDTNIYLFIVHAADTDTVRIVDTLHAVTFYADSLFAIRSLHINMGDIVNNDASGNYAFAGGWRDTVSGDYSFGWDVGGDITGNYCAGFGYGNNISGNYSFAGGGEHDISGTYSTSFGQNCDIEQWWSFATGRNAWIRGDPAYDSISQCFGIGVIDSVPHAFLIGDEAGDVLDRPHTFKVALDSAAVFVPNVECSANVYIEGETFFSDDIWSLDGKYHYFIDASGADTNWITETANALTIGGDNNVKISKPLFLESSLWGLTETNIEWDGYEWYIDYDNDNAIAFISFHNEDSIKVDTTDHVMEWT